MLWDVQHIYVLFGHLAEVHLTVHLAKCEFAKPTVTYLGRVVGQGHVRPVDAMVGAVEQYPVPSTRGAHVFLGLGWLSPLLTDLLKGQVKNVWPPRCQTAFENVKSLFVPYSGPGCTKLFKILVVASQIRAVLLQETDGAD